MEYVQLRSFDNYIEANIVLNSLRHENINCHLKDENIITIDPLLSPALGGMKLMVHHAQADRARHLLQRAEEDYLQTIACPACTAHALTITYVQKKDTSLLHAVYTRLFGASAAPLQKQYHCTACGHTFAHLPS